MRFLICSFASVFLLSFTILAKANDDDKGKGKGKGKGKEEKEVSNQNQHYYRIFSSIDNTLFGMTLPSPVQIDFLTADEYEKFFELLYSRYNDAELSERSEEESTRVDINISSDDIRKLITEIRNSSEEANQEEENDESFENGSGSFGGPSSRNQTEDEKNQDAEFRLSLGSSRAHLRRLNLLPQKRFLVENQNPHSIEWELNRLELSFFGYPNFK